MAVMSAVAIWGIVSGTYKPPSRASPANIASSKDNTGAFPRVEMYFIIMSLKF